VLLSVGLGLLFILYLGVFFYYRLAWKSHYPEQQVNTLIANIKSAPKLTDSFYFLYDKCYNNRHERITARFFKGFWDEFVFAKYPLEDNWQYVVANMQEYKGFRYNRAPMTLAFRIDQDVTPEQCFDYMLAGLYSEYCREFKISDAITNLDDKERIIRFIVASARPRYYRTHLTDFNRKVDSVRALIDLN